MSIFSRRPLDAVCSLLIVLFPLFAVLLQNWASTIFILLSLLSLAYIKQGFSLVKEPMRWIFIGMVGFFLVFLLKATLLGWEKPEVRSLGSEIFFLFIIPISCMAACLKNTKERLIQSLFVTLIIMTLWGSYVVFYQGNDYFIGAYNRLRVGALALLAGMICTVYFYQKKSYLLAIVSYFLGAYIIYLSHGRMSMIALVLLSLLLVFVLIPGFKRKLIMVSTLLILLGIGWQSSDTWRERIISSTQKLTDYIQHPENYPHDRKVGSWVIHYMMIEASVMLWKENPTLGVGRNRYIEHMKIYVDEGKVHPILAHKDLVSPHTLWAEILASKGVLGLGFFILFLLACLKRVYELGMQDLSLFIFISTVVLTGVAEAWWIIMNSFMAMLVLFTAVLASNHKLGSSNSNASS